LKWAVYDLAGLIVIAGELAYCLLGM